MTKNEIMDALFENNITFNPKAKKDVLEALLKEHVSVDEETAVDEDVVEVIEPKLLPTEREITKARKKLIALYKIRREKNVEDEINVLINFIQGK